MSDKEYTSLLEELREIKKELKEQREEIGNLKIQVTKLFTLLTNGGGLIKRIENCEKRDWKMMFFMATFTISVLTAIFVFLK